MKNISGFLVLLFFTILFSPSYSQQGILTTIPSTGKNVESFIPKGYEVLGTAKGNLNKDSLEDEVIVLKSQQENDEVLLSDSLPPRILMILFKTATGFSLSAISNAAVLCRTCGGAFGDPFESIDVNKKGVLTIHHYAGSNWRWANAYKFRFQNGDWYLIGRMVMGYFDGAACDDRGLKGEFVSTNYKEENLVTGDTYVKKISEDCKKTESKTKVKPKPLIKLKDFNAEKDLENSQN